MVNSPEIEEVEGDIWRREGGDGFDGDEGEGGRV